ncbi:MAG: hypothetical protein H6555_00855 [Lewinellaceae bacterium]|nr:hypothetical protein [Lewinellaceae bacterium]
MGATYRTRPLYPDTIVKVPLDIRGQITKIRETEVHHVSHQALLLNGSPMSYGYFKLDNESRAYFLTKIPQIQDPLLRGAAWMALFEDCLHQRVTPAVLLEAILKALPTEQEPLNRQQLLSYLQTLYWRFSSDTVRADLAPRVEELLWHLLEKADNGGARTAYYNAYESMAISEAGVNRLRVIWEGKVAVPGLPLSEAQHLDLACELAIRLPAEAVTILDQETTNLKIQTGNGGLPSSVRPCPPKKWFAIPFSNAPGPCQSLH